MIRFPLPILALSLAAGPIQAQEAASEAFSITNVTVVDVRTGAIRPNMTVKVSGSRIRSISSGDATVGAQRTIDGRGKYLIPGLIETHAHHFMQWVRQPADTVPYFGWILASGVTTTRDALWAGEEERLIALREAQKTGELLGPRIHVSALVDPAALERLGGPSVREAVAHFQQLGADAIKVRAAPPEFRLEVIREAVRAGMPVWGHGGGIPLDAARAGIGGITHTVPFGFRDGNPDLDGLEPRRQGAVWYHYKLSGWLDPPERLDSLVDTLVARGVWLEPTLAYSYLPVSGDEYDVMALRRYSPWYASEQLPLTEQEREEALAALRAAGDFVRRFVEAGGMVVAGTDHIPHPPLGVTEEMRRLADTGLPPLAALRAATIHAAGALGWADRLGSIEEGKLADLVLLDANPLEDIMNVRRVQVVITNGRVLDRAALDTLLAGVATPPSPAR